MWEGWGRCVVMVVRVPVVLSLGVHVAWTEDTKFRCPLPSPIRLSTQAVELVCVTVCSSLFEIG